MSNPYYEVKKGLDICVMLNKNSGETDMIILPSTKKAISVRSTTELINKLRSYDVSTEEIKKALVFVNQILRARYRIGYKDKIKMLREIIREHGGKVSKEDIYDKAQAQGISKDTAEEIIAKLKQQGDIFEPATGYFRLA